MLLFSCRIEITPKQQFLKICISNCYFNCRLRAGEGNHTHTQKKKQIGNQIFYKIDPAFYLWRNKIFSFFFWHFFFGFGHCSVFWQTASKSFLATLQELTNIQVMLSIIWDRKQVYIPTIYGSRQAGKNISKLEKSQIASQTCSNTCCRSSSFTSSRS